MSPLRLWVVFALVWVSSIGPMLQATLAGDASGDQYYVVKVWGADDGLTEGSATDVAQTPEGYLWVGTVFGSVLRFDGSRFVSYSSANTPGFLMKWGVPRLMVDHAGTLWISMHDGGMTTWDHDGFKPAFTGSNQPSSLVWSSGNRVIFAFDDGRLLSGERTGDKWQWMVSDLPDRSDTNEPCADAMGQIWYKDERHNIRVWSGGTSATTCSLIGLDNQKVQVLSADVAGHIWLGTDHCLAEWQHDHFAVMTPTNGEPLIDVSRIVASGTSGLWIEANHRMRRYLDRQWQAESTGWNQKLSDVDYLRFLHGDAAGGLWSSAGDLGLIHVLPDGTFHQLTTRDGLPSNTINFAYQDHDGNTWIGYERGGLVQVRPRLFYTIGKEQGLKENLINTVCSDSSGTVWIGTHGGIIGSYQNGICTNLHLPGAAVLQDSCAVADRRGNVWLGAQGGGIWLYEKGQLKLVIAASQLQGYPRLLLASSDGALWIGTLYSIVRFENHRLEREYTAATPGDHPTALTQTADGTVWAGTLAGNFLRWDGEKFIQITPPDRNLLGRIWALWPAPDDSLWAGTEEGGLLHLKSGLFERWTKKNGLPSDSITQILGDQSGNLWLGTRAGIVRIAASALPPFERGELNELSVSSFGPGDGLMTIGSAIIFQPNCWCGQDGQLYFAMANSIAFVDPNSIKINQTAPNVALEELRVNDLPVWPDHVGAVLTSAADASSAHRATLPQIKVGPGRTDLEFSYAGLSFNSPQHIRFRYRLQGLEETWNEVGAERNAIYRYVPPGKYVLHLEAANSDAVWSPDLSVIAVEVVPFFYQANWFRILAGLALALGLCAVVAYSIRRRAYQRLEQMLRQHELERERSRISHDLHDDLGAGLTEISLLGGLLQEPSRLSTGRQEALQRIVQRCHDLVVALDEIVWAVNPRNDTVNSLAGYLGRYAQGFLEPTAIRCRLDVTEAEPDRPLKSEQRHHLYLAVKEALTNVVKHSGATEVRLKIRVAGRDQLTISIEDNGTGLPSVPEEKADADGLENLRQRLSQIGGQCDIVNGPMGGAAVKLTLWLTQDRH